VDFIINLPIIVKHHDFIMALVDKLTNIAHFILVKSTHKKTNIVEIYVK
jgi:prephenate dehydrogenase